MSRLATKPVVLKDGISCVVEDSYIKLSCAGNVKEFPFNSKYLNVEVQKNEVLFSRSSAVKTPTHLKGLLGTTLALFKQAVSDLTAGYSAKLNFVGVGYKAQVVKAGQYNYLRMSLGFSHPIFVFIPKGIEVKMEKETAIVSGKDTQTVMQFCAKTRSHKKPTVYHGTGIIMNNEVILKKVGKKK